MALSTTKVNASGAKLKMGDGASPEVFTLVPGVLTFGKLGNKGTFEESTPIDKTAREYFAGLKESPDMEISMEDLPGNSVQQDLITHADAGDTVNFKVEIATGQTASFALVLNGHEVMEQEHNKVVSRTVYGKVTGTVTFSTTA